MSTGTHSMSQITEIIEKKFNEIKTTLLEELQTEFRKLFAGVNVEIVESKKK